MMEQCKYKYIVCLCGNDGTGKSTMVKNLNANPQFIALERSLKTNNSSYNELIKSIKYIDKLTFKYSFEEQRAKYKPPTSHEIQFNSLKYTLPVFWIMLDASPSTIFKRVANREQLSIYQSKKCVQYYQTVYRDIAYYYGMPIFRTDTSETSQAIAQKIMQIVTTKRYEMIYHTAMRDLTYQRIDALNVENIVQKSLKLSDAQQIFVSLKKHMKEKQQSAYNFFYPELNQYEQSILTKLVARQIVQKGKFNKSLTKIAYQTMQKQYIVNLEHDGLILYLIDEGESKMIYQIYSQYSQINENFKDIIIIVLKSTIYSHKKQHTGEIENLASIRAQGSQLFLEVMRRNDLKHAYISINKLGIIYSKKVKTNKMEIVFKTQLIGTDKHSYHGVSTAHIQKCKQINIQSINKLNYIEQTPSIIHPQNKNLINEVYIRYDWRNPNHILESDQDFMINQHSFYYLVERHLAKQIFFVKYLTKKCIPLGDKCITSQMVSSYINKQMIDKIMLKMYCAMQYYLNKVNLKLIDGCIMVDEYGTVWSQINPDCMRVKSLKDNTDYDKDIWRYGGSNSKQKIVQKWKLFNSILIQYFQKNRFHETQLWQINNYPYQHTAQLLKQKAPNSCYALIFQQFIRGKKNRQVIGTIDLQKGQPVLVKSSVISENHHSFDEATDYLKVLNKTVLVDLDGAFGQQQSPNPKLIRQYSNTRFNNVYGVGGGIRNQQRFKFYNKSPIPYQIVSTNLEMLNDINLQSIIVELSINQNNQILINGRKQNTHINVITKLIQLSRKGIKIVSITIVKSEGKLQGLQRKQITQLLVQVPGNIQKVIIAGGITTLDDLLFLWRFEKCIPQLGSAIWKNTIALHEIINNIIKFKILHRTNKNTLLCPCIVYDNKSCNVLGQVYMDKQAIKNTIQTRKLWRFSREHDKLMMKGQTSNNIMKVDWLRVDCDNDAILVGVTADKQQHLPAQFCHMKESSCFSLPMIHNLNTLQEHIRSKIDQGGYSSKLQQNIGFAQYKIIEETNQMFLAQQSEHKYQEASDMLAHLLMYMNGLGLKNQKIIQILNQKSYKTTTPLEVNYGKSLSTGNTLVGIISGKHCNFCDEFCENELGIKISRPKNRNLAINFDIQNKQIINKYFGNQPFSLIGMKSKDMPMVLSKNKIKYCINYSIMMDNNPQVSKCLHKSLVKGLKLALIKRKDEKINPKQWTPQAKGLIASEYPLTTTQYFVKKLGVNEKNFTILKISGCSQSYLRGKQFHYCDAIVVTGSTLRDNNLQIEEVLTDSICVGLYEVI